MTPNRRIRDVRPTPFRLAGEIVMRIKSFIVACAALVAVAASGPRPRRPARASPMSRASSAFCPNVEWLKNRAHHARMHVGDALLPERSGHAAVDGRIHEPARRRADAGRADAGQRGRRSWSTRRSTRCSARHPAPGFAVTGFPRRAYVNGAAHLSSPAGRARCPRERPRLDQQRRVVDPDREQRPLRVVVPGIDAAAARVARARSAGSTSPSGRRCASRVGLTRFAGTGTSVMAGCNLSVQIGNRNAAVERRSIPERVSASATRARRRRMAPSSFVRPGSMCQNRPR